jgi:hypothetical protein
MGACLILELMDQIRSEKTLEETFEIRFTNEWEEKEVILKGLLGFWALEQSKVIEKEASDYNIKKWRKS